jgi:3-hydroxyisobutyrate dehydrogenase
LDAIETTAEDAGTPHPLTTAVAELHRAALHHYGPVDGELMGPAWLEEQAGTRLSGE